MVRLKGFLVLSAMALVGCRLLTWDGGGSDWPEEYARILSQLTYPQSEWRHDDFGRPISAKDRGLLTRFRPRIHITPGELYPIDFYDRFLPQTVVKNRKGTVIPRAVDPAYLKRIERDHGKYLDFGGDLATFALGGDPPEDAVLYPSVYREQLRLPGREPIDVIVLKYAAVFAASGLPYEIGWLRSAAARLMGDPRRWHELDIHGAVHVIIDAAHRRPLMVLLAQHNHFRSFLVGRDLEWPADDRLRISYARRSNEPYLSPRGATPVRHPTAGNPSHFRFILTGRGKPLTGGYDVVHGPQSGAVEIPYQLIFLRTKDPLFTSWIPLGDKQKLMGVIDSFYREGPPGMHINTHPQIRRYTDTAAAYYVLPGDSAGIDLFETHVKGFIKADFGPVLAYNRQVLARRWTGARALVPGSISASHPVSALRDDTARRAWPAR
ncbi:MAG: hypothetical protein QNJ22_13210 [Desulfosarcinaceae bacterium]|nr:hypothetical protein [Desulfosarcinaceae bacterium]